MVYMDDKHRMKVGEPGFPVAAAERGRRVLVKVGTSLEVADHDFMQFSLIPSVILQNEVPDDVTGSWCRGKVHVILKEPAFEPSSSMRHMAELCSILTSQQCKKALMIYTKDQIIGLAIYLFNWLLLQHSRSLILIFYELHTLYHAIVERVML